MVEKSKRWSRAETVYLINAMEDLKIIERSDGRKHKNAELFKTVTVFTSGKTLTSCLRSSNQKPSQPQTLR